MMNFTVEFQNKVEDIHQSIKTVWDDLKQGAGIIERLIEEAAEQESKSIVSLTTLFSKCEIISRFKL